MRALTVLVRAGNSARLDDLPELALKADTLLIRGIAVGVCGTDREIIEGGYGWVPPGRKRSRPGVPALSLQSRGEWQSALEQRADDDEVVIDLGP